MDDNGFIYYLILGAIYLLSRLFIKKNPNKPGQRPAAPRANVPQEGAPPRRPVSFEEILKELSRELVPEEQRQPKVIEVEEAPKKVVEKPKQPELTREQLYVKKRHEQRDREEKLALEREQKELQEAHEPHEVLELLREEGGAANAIILSEILNRKY